jgi:hypothetical protein
MFCVSTRLALFSRFPAGRRWEVIEILLFVWQKWGILVQMSISLFSKSYGKSSLKFSERGFPHNFAKNDRQALKMGCTDASRRQLQSVPKMGD